MGFDIVVFGPDDETKMPGKRDAREPSEEDLRGQMEIVRKLLDANVAQQALVLAWSVLEAAMRRRLRAEGEEAGWGSSPRTMMNELLSSGALSNGVFRDLEGLFQARSAIVHGFTLPAIEPSRRELHSGRSPEDPGRSQADEAARLKRCKDRENDNFRSWRAGRWLGSKTPGSAPRDALAELWLGSKTPGSAPASPQWGEPVAGPRGLRPQPPLRPGSHPSVSPNWRRRGRRSHLFARRSRTLLTQPPAGCLGSVGDKSGSVGRLANG